MTDTPNSPVSLSEIWKQAVALVIEARLMGITRVISGYTPNETTDPEMVRMTKYIIDDPAYRAIGNLDRRVKAQLGKIGLPVSRYLKGVVLIPFSLIERAEDILERYQEDRKAAVLALQAAFPTLMAQAQSKLDTMYDPSDYPDAAQIPERFSVSIQYLTFDLPGALGSISERARQRAFAEGEHKLQAAVDEVQQYLRQTLAGLVTQLRDRLTPDPVTGEAKVLQTRTMTNLLEFMDTFAARNRVAQDGQLESLVTQAKQLLAGVEAPELRSDEALRHVVRTGLEDIAQRMDGLLVKKPTRKYNWDEAA